MTRKPKSKKQKRSKSEPSAIQLDKELQDQVITLFNLMRRRDLKAQEQLLTLAKKNPRIDKLLRKLVRDARKEPRPAGNPHTSKNIREDGMWPYRT